MGAVLFAVFAAGCGSTRASSPTTSTSSPTTVVTTARTTTEDTTTHAAAHAAKPAPMLRVGAYNLASGVGGYKARLEYIFGAVEHASSLAPLPVSGRAVLASCQVNPSADAVIPVSYTLTNTTPQFSTPATLTINDLTPGVASGDAVVGGGAICGRVDIPLLGVHWDMIGSGQSVSGDLFVIVPNYFSPAKPSGDPALLTQVCIGMQVGYGTQGLPILDPVPFSDLSKQVFSLKPGGRC
jgi:hypothetical protein